MIPNNKPHWSFKIHQYNTGAPLVPTQNLRHIPAREPEQPALSSHLYRHSPFPSTNNGPIIPPNFLSPVPDTSPPRDLPWRLPRTASPHPSPVCLIHEVTTRNVYFLIICSPKQTATSLRTGVLSVLLMMGYQVLAQCLTHSRHAKIIWHVNKWVHKWAVVTVCKPFYFSGLWLSCQ